MNAQTECESERLNSATFHHQVFYYQIIGILPAYTRYRLVGKVHPPLVSNVEQVERAGQLHLRKGSRARLIKLHMSGAGQDHLRNHYSGSGRLNFTSFLCIT